MINQRNIYKQQNTILLMKKGVGITLDVDVVKAIKKIQSNSRGTKFSSLVNDLLREHPEIKKLLNKNNKKK